MMGRGSWNLYSEKDPRWNCSGPASALSFPERPPEVDEAIERLKKTLGEQPDDLEYSCMKD